MAPYVRGTPVNVCVECAPGGGMSAGVSRRTLLKGVGGVAFLGASAAVLPLFSTPSKKQTPESCPSTDLSSSQKELIISNWQAYIDPFKKDPDATLNVFEDETGIDVTYTDDVTDNQEFFAKVVNQLGSCETVKRDMFMLTDWMAARMINMGWIQPLNKANVPNLDKNLISSLQGVGWDPKREYSAPWQAGFTGIAYNKTLVG